VAKAWAVLLGRREWSKRPSWRGLDSPNGESGGGPPLSQNASATIPKAPRGEPPHVETFRPRQVRDTYRTVPQTIRAEESELISEERRLRSFVDFIGKGRGSQALANALIETEGMLQDVDAGRYVPARRQGGDVT
jgi:hypothetical protein